jgi:hypothetical protein
MLLFVISSVAIFTENASKPAFLHVFGQPQLSKPKNHLLPKYHIVSGGFLQTNIVARGGGIHAQKGS